MALRRADWDKLDHWLSLGKSLSKLDPQIIGEAASLYRAVVSDLMRARSLGYSADLQHFLDQLAARAHGMFYQSPPYRVGAIWTWLVREFPTTLRRYAWFFLVAAALFVIPGIVGFVLAKASPSFVHQVMPAEAIAHMEKSYGPAFLEGRDIDTNAQMAGFYVNNNVGIAFRCFALGIFFGLGSIFFLVYNGLLIGVVAGHLARVGYLGNLLLFTSGHSSLELTAIVISGTAGLLMGYSLVDTQGLTRFGSLRARSKDLTNLVLGAGFMLLLAAMVEGFWSPNHFSGAVKGAFAATVAVTVFLYLWGAGRTKRIKRS